MRSDSCPVVVLVVAFAFAARCRPCDGFVINGGNEDRQPNHQQLSNDDENNNQNTRVPSASNRVAFEEQHGLRKVKWANAAWDLVRKADCNSAVFAAPDGCRSLRAVDRQNVTVYLATSSSSAAAAGDGKLSSVLPDGRLVSWDGSGWRADESGTADAVLVLDPYPGASFGHLVLVFLVHARVSEAWCGLRRGIFLVEHEDCLENVVTECPDAGNSTTSEVTCSSPETAAVEFLPLVTAAAAEAGDAGPRASSFSRQDGQLLACRSDVSGFAQHECPPTDVDPSSGNDPASHLSSSSVVVAGVRHRRPGTCVSSSSSAAVGPEDNDEDGGVGAGAGADGNSSAACVRVPISPGARCRLFETCDHAVAVVGGWNRQTAASQGLTSLRQFYKMLRRNGFSKTNVKTFFEDGFDLSQSELTEFGGRDAVYPAASKTAIRGYLRSVCRAPGCADSLVVYLNSPTLADGTSLLWDADGDGQASEEERYRVAELVEDLSGCSAARVVVVADQSHSGKIVSAVARAFSGEQQQQQQQQRGAGPASNDSSPSAAATDGNGLANVVVMASGDEDDYAWGGEFTRSWAYAKHQQTCLADVQEQAKAAARGSQPTSFDEGRISRAKTIFGAPCNVFSPFTYRELRTNYLGCQTVPTRVWLEMHAPSRRPQSSGSASSSSPSFPASQPASTAEDADPDAGSQETT